MAGKNWDRQLEVRGAASSNRANDTTSDVGKAPLGFGLTTQKLGWDLVQMQTEDGDMTNTILSPLSVVVLLGLVAGGAAASRKAEWCQKLGVKGMEQLTAAYAGLIRALDANTADSPLAVANAIFTDESFTFFPDFERHAQAYAAETQQVESLPGAVDMINGWIASQTRDLIKDMLSAGDLAGAPLALVNALAFKGSWKTKFYRRWTVADYKFHITRQLSCNVEMMFGRDLDVDTWYEDRFTAVRLPYQSTSPESATCLIAYLPGDGLPLEDILPDVRNSNGEHAFMPCHYTKFGFPKFDIETKVNMAGLLARLGYPLTGEYPLMGTSTSGGADLSQVLHRAIIKLDEEGTEAAAVTVMVGRGGRMRPPRPMEIIFDRPFAFAIQAVESRVVLFAGVFAGEPGGQK